MAFAWESIGASNKKEAIKAAAFEVKGYSPRGTLKGVKKYFRQPRVGSFEDYVSSLEIFVVGVKPKEKTGKSENDDQISHIVYAMKVTDVLTFDEYWNNHDFEAKKPESRYFTENEGNDGSFFPDDCGDNVYEITMDDEGLRSDPRSGPRIVIHPSFHYFKNSDSDPIPQACTDLGGLYVLVSREGNFSYFGKRAYIGEGNEKEPFIWKGEPLHEGRAHSIYHDPKTEKGQKELTPEIRKGVLKLIEEKPGIQAEPNGYAGSEVCIGKEWWDRRR